MISGNYIFKMAATDKVAKKMPDFGTRLRCYSWNRTSNNYV